jgi:hypothetical protein
MKLLLAGLIFPAYALLNCSRMRKLFLSILILFVGQQTLASSSVTTCYTHVILMGRLQEIDSVLKKIQSLFIVHDPVHRPENNQLASIEFLISITSVDAKTAREHTGPQFVKDILGVAGNSQSNGTAANFLGCKTETLK